MGGPRFQIPEGAMVLGGVTIPAGEWTAEEIAAMVPGAKVVTDRMLQAPVPDTVPHIRSYDLGKVQPRPRLHAQAILLACTTLDELHAVIGRYLALVLRFEISRVEYEDDVNLGALPRFGGEHPPRHLAGVVSWDAGRVLVIDNGQARILQRAEIPATPPAAPRPQPTAGQLAALVIPVVEALGEGAIVVEREPDRSGRYVVRTYRFEGAQVVEDSERRLKVHELVHLADKLRFQYRSES